MSTLIGQKQYFWFILAVGLFLACGNGGQVPGFQGITGGGRGTDAHGEGSQQPSPSQSDSAGSKEPSPMKKVGEQGKESPELVRRLDFALNLERAHLRSNGILIDFGTPARNKHTLGDWRSGFRGNYDEKGTTFSFVAASRAHIFFDVFPNEEGGGIIAFRGRAEGSTKANIRLNGKSIGVVEFPRGKFGHAALRLEKGLVSGQNHISIDCSRRRNSSDGGLSAIALDYVRISSEKDGQGPSAAAFDEPRYPDQAGGRTGILLSPSESLTFNTVVHAGSRLRGQARTRRNGDRASFFVTVATGGKEPETVFSKELTERTSAADIVLDSYAGKMASITVGALGSEVVLKEMGLYHAVAETKRAPGELRAKNIVLVLIDTLRADKLTAYNRRTRVRTPYLDKLAGESMVFSRTLAPENWTKPSIASMLSGLWPETHRTQDDRARVPGSVTIASEHFKALGFTTAGFVANGYVSGKFGFKKGWDRWVNYVREGKRNRAQYVVDDAVKWLAERDKEKPFFLYVHTIDPHVPYIPPSNYWSLYDPGPYKGPVSPTGTAKLLEKVKTRKVTLSRRDKFRLEALYDGEITYHDDQLVRLHQALEASADLDDTAIIVTSDHGEEFFEHGLVGHGHSLYEELIHVPLFMRLPGAKPDLGAVSEEEVSLVDVFPTICDLLAVVCPEGVEGRSLLPHLKGEPAPFTSNASVSYFLSGQRAVRIGRFKAIYKGLRSEVYDLETDPRETHNLRNMESTILAGLRDALGEHLGRFVPTKQVAPKREKKKHAGEKAVLDPETKKQLKALGYLGGEQ